MVLHIRHLESSAIEGGLLKDDHDVRFFFSRSSSLRHLFCGLSKVRVVCAPGDIKIRTPNSVGLRVHGMVAVTGGFR